MLFDFNQIRGMEKLFDLILKNRSILHNHLQNTPKEKLFEIPEGFNNNIWWNIAHIVVSEQLLVYGLSGQPLVAPEDLVEKYRKGTKPNGIASDAEIELVSELMFSLPKKTAEDYKAGVFDSYNPYTTSLNIELSSVEDAVAYDLLHEGIHLGTITALKKVLERDS